jgi:hypothetical protein
VGDFFAKQVILYVHKPQHAFKQIEDGSSQGVDFILQARIFIEQIIRTIFNSVVFVLFCKHLAAVVALSHRITFALLGPPWGKQGGVA